jgi:hypothetical protein
MNRSTSIPGGMFQTPNSNQSMPAPPPGFSLFGQQLPTPAVSSDLNSPWTKAVNSSSFSGFPVGNVPSPVAPPPGLMNPTASLQSGPWLSATAQPLPQQFQTAQQAPPGSMFNTFSTASSPAWIGQNQQQQQQQKQREEPMWPPQPQQPFQGFHPSSFSNWR